MKLKKLREKLESEVEPRFALNEFLEERRFLSENSTTKHSNIAKEFGKLYNSNLKKMALWRLVFVDLIIISKLKR